MGKYDQWTISEWQSDVANGDTRLGYKEWVDYNVESEQEQCDCVDRSWYGAEHDSVCPLAGLPNPNSKVRP